MRIPTCDDGIKYELIEDISKRSFFLSHADLEWAYADAASQNRGLAGDVGKEIESLFHCLDVARVEERPQVRYLLPLGVHVFRRRYGVDLPHLKVLRGSH